MAARLCLSEREEIRVRISREESFAQIGRRLGRDKSTISREVGGRAGRESYRACVAHEAATLRARRPKGFRLVLDPSLAARVEAWMDEKYSPQTVSRILGGEGLFVSAETIYQAAYNPGRGLGTEAWKDLPRRRQKRKHAGKKWGITSGNPLGRPVSVHDRHPTAADRSEPGHTEGDLITGAHNRSAVLTACERISRYTWLVALPDGYGTVPVAHALHDLLDSIPPRMRRSLTWDQGREMKFWADVQAGTGTPIYFCDPHSPWQKPTVENNNGILRRWLPKGTRLDTYTQDDLDEIARKINNMPRRIHGWRTAQQVYDELVAATT